MNHKFLASLFVCSLSGAVHSAPMPLAEVSKLAGCFIVDYNYSETEVIDPEYPLDPRVYDVGKFTVKELIKVVDQDDSQIRIQHYMQAENFAGRTIFMMRHHGEVWRKNPSFRYKYLGRFEGEDRWDVEHLDTDKEQWVREITSLDDGLRYQCLGKWKEGAYFPRFDCEAFAPIPGRETRDMGRGDYNTMERQSSVLLYQDSWLERQKNIKVQFSSANSNPLVKELGKVWSVRVPMSECEQIASWAEERQSFWDVLASAWKDAYDGTRPFYEIKTVNGSTRSAKIAALMEQHYKTIGGNQELAEKVKAEIAAIIEAHRE